MKTKRLEQLRREIEKSRCAVLDRLEALIKATKEESTKDELISIGVLLMGQGVAVKLIKDEMGE